jgi:hypothetical protein
MFDEQRLAEAILNWLEKMTQANLGEYLTEAGLLVPIARFFDNSAYQIVPEFREDAVKGAARTDYVIFDLTGKPLASFEAKFIRQERSAAKYIHDLMRDVVRLSISRDGRLAYFVLVSTDRFPTSQGRSRIVSWEAFFANVLCEESIRFDAASDSEFFQTLWYIQDGLKIEGVPRHIDIRRVGHACTAVSGFEVGIWSIKCGGPELVSLERDGKLFRKMVGPS